MEESYTNGGLEGISKIYDENGKLKEQWHYKDGNEKGIIKSYHKNGKLKKVKTLKNDMKEGITRLYDENGNLKLEANYKNDKLDGTTKLRHENGKLKFEANYKNGKKDGISKLYYESGETWYIETHKDGQKIDRKAYDRRGKLEFDQDYPYTEEQFVSNSDQVEPSNCQLTWATERRKHIRFSPKDNTYAYAALGKENSKVGMIKDISIGGLAFEINIDDDSQTGIMPKVDIFLSNNEFFLSNVPCTIVYKKSVQTDSTNPTLTSPFKSSRYGLKFDELSKDQAEKLVFFLKSYTYTTEISATQSYVYCNS